MRDCFHPRGVPAATRRSRRILHVHSAPLLDPLHATGATLLPSANLGCRLHLARGTSVPVRRPVEFLAGRLDMDVSSRR